LKKLAFFCLLFISIQSIAQIRDKMLYGFATGQSRDVLKKEFKEVFRSGTYGDGAEYEIYLLSPDRSAYIVFEFNPYNSQIIKSIQVSGKNPDVEIGYKGLRLGDDKSAVEEIFGTIIFKQTIDAETELWNYGSDLNVEITNGVLSSIKITDNSYDNKETPANLPVFSEILNILQSGSNQQIAEILMPNAEIYYRDQFLSFERSLQNEIEKDYSKLFATIRQISRGLEAVDPQNPYMYEESERVIPLQKNKHVMKIKTGHLIKEIVFEPVNGKYLILEIHAD